MKTKRKTYGQFTDDVRDVGHRDTDEILSRCEVKVLLKSCNFGARKGKRRCAISAATLSKRKVDFRTHFPLDWVASVTHDNERVSTRRCGARRRSQQAHIFERLR